MQCSTTSSACLARPAAALPALPAVRCWRRTPACQGVAPREGVACCAAPQSPRGPTPADHAQPLPVFALHADVPIGKMEYIEDALETCSVTASKEERRQCFETFGLDADKVDRYYGPVSAFERLIAQDDNVGYQVVSSGGAGLLWLVALCLLKTP